MASVQLGPFVPRDPRSRGRSLSNGGHEALHEAGARCISDLTAVHLPVPVLMSMLGTSSQGKESIL